jgi:hypothetical protein
LYAYVQALFLLCVPSIGSWIQLAPDQYPGLTAPSRFSTLDRVEVLRIDLLWFLYELQQAVYLQDIATLIPAQIKGSEKPLLYMEQGLFLRANSI